MALVIMYEPGMQHIDSKINDAAFESCKQIAADARSYTPVKTGAMRRSIRARRTTNGARVYVGTDHWYYIEYGVEPHIIQTRRASTGSRTGPKVLADKERRKFFTSIVQHPGVNARMPLRRAFFQKRSMATLVIEDKADNFTVGGGFTAGETYG